MLKMVYQMRLLQATGIVKLTDPGEEWESAPPPSSTHLTPRHVTANYYSTSRGVSGREYTVSRGVLQDPLNI